MARFSFLVIEMERSIALFISGRKSFFREVACINCSVDEYCACDGADVLFDVDRVMRKGLVDVGQGVRITEPIKVEKGLLVGDNIYVSLSHDGILAICPNYSTIQLTDLNINKQVEMEVEDDSLVAFYDDIILLLTFRKPLREARVEEVFENPTIETFKKIEGTSDVKPYTDVSLLHDRRELYYYTVYRRLFSFNVDTRENTKINIGRRVGPIASLTGIDSGVKAVFYSFDDNCIYALNNDNTVTKVNGENGCLEALFPSASNPKNIKDALFKYNDNLVKNGNKLDTSKLINFSGHSVIRIYRDIFLTFDLSTNSWVILRIVVP